MALNKIDHDFGCFYYVDSERASEVNYKINLPNFIVYSATYRNSSCWMTQKTGNKMSDIPPETQFLLLYDGSIYTAIFALADNKTRSSLFYQDKSIFIKSETGDKFTNVENCFILFSARGDNPYQLIKKSYDCLSKKLKNFTTKECKTHPFLSKNLGYCTYNAFGEDISEDKILSIAQKFKDNGQQLNFIIVDIGWQQTDNNRLISFCADKQKFPHGLAHTIDILKRDFKLKKFYCWMTYNGFWSGLDENRFKKFDVSLVKANCSFEKNVDFIESHDTVTGEFYPYELFRQTCGMPQKDFYDFYASFFFELRKQGVDGVKIDAMCWCEVFAEGRGGRVELFRNIIRSIESASTVFDGEYLTCSSCSNDFFFNIKECNLTRSSSDYDPNLPDSHALHIRNNANAAFWVDDIIYCDWDMFQTEGKAGLFHALGRSMSGSPLYSSDNLENLDFAVIKKLVTSEGMAPPIISSCKPVRESLFYSDSNKLYKVWNHFEYGDIIGVFNCIALQQDRIICDSVKASDAEIEKNGNFAVFSSIRGFLGVYHKDQEITVSLSSLSAEIITFAPIIDGIAIIGLINKYNPSAFIQKVTRFSNKVVVETMDKDVILFYSNKVIKNLDNFTQICDTIYSIHTNWCEILI